MKRLLHIFQKKPFVLDLMVIALLPLFSHYLVTLQRREDFAELRQMKPYWIALLFSMTCGLIVIAYIRLSNRKLNKDYGIADSVEIRIVKQLKWNLLLPALFVIILVAIYYYVLGTDIVIREYFSRELVIVLLAIFFLNVLYGGLDVLVYLADSREEEAYFRYALVDPVAAGSVMLDVKSLHINARKRIPIDEVALLERRNRRTYVYPFTGEVYELPMPTGQLAKMLLTNGLTWLNQWYCLRRDSVDKLVGKGDKGCALRLSKGIVLLPSAQVWQQEDEGEVRTYLNIHKNKAKDVRLWYGMEQ